MDKYSLSLVPEIVPGSTRVNTEQHKKTKTTQKGDLYDDITYETTVVADMVWTWIDNENPEERVGVPWAQRQQPCRVLRAGRDVVRAGRALPAVHGA
jgi:hypothetical protein